MIRPADMSGPEYLAKLRALADVFTMEQLELIRLAVAASLGDPEEWEPEYEGDEDPLQIAAEILVDAINVTRGPMPPGSGWPNDI